MVVGSFLAEVESFSACVKASKVLVYSVLLLCSSFFISVVIGVVVFCLSLVCKLAIEGAFYMLAVFVSVAISVDVICFSFVCRVCCVTIEGAC